MVPKNTLLLAGAPSSPISRSSRAVGKLCGSRGVIIKASKHIQVFANRTIADLVSAILDVDLKGKVACSSREITVKTAGAWTHGLPIPASGQ